MKNRKLLTSLSLIFITLTTNVCYAEYDFDKYIVLGETFLKALSITMIKSIIIVAVIRMGSVYISNRNVSSKIVDIFKETVGILLFLYLIPKIPNILSLILL